MKDRFILDKTSKKYPCPRCGKNRFVRFLDQQTKQLLPPEYGRCDREANCGYFLNPFNDGFAFEIMKEENKQPGQWISRQPQQPQIKDQAFVIIPLEILQATQSRPIEQNTFFENLLNNVPFPFDPDDLIKVSKLYQTGTIIKGYLSGATSFPFIDKANACRAIQVKQFNEQNHTTRTSFIHALLSNHYQQTKQPLPDWLKAYNQQEKKVSCLFGEHLLNQYPGNPIALVEAPKTCIYGTLYFGFPENPANLLWLSSFNLSSLNYEKCKVLAGRTVVLFPDLSATGKAFELWKEKAKQFEKQIPNTKFIVSELLEQNASLEERAKGLDLADFLIQQDWRQYRIEAKPIEQNNVRSQPNISELEKLFAALPIPETPIQLNPCETVLYPKQFIQNSLSIIKANNGKKTFQAQYMKLLKIAEILNTP